MAEAQGDDDGGMIRTTGPGMGRRNFMRAAAAGAGAAALGASTQTRFSPIGETEAVVPLAIYGAGAVGAIAAGWMIYEFSDFGGDGSPDTGLANEVYVQSSIQAVQNRSSQNTSTMIDNRNLVDRMGHLEFHKAKIAGIEALQNGSPTESEFITAMENEAESHIVTVEKNLLKSWNEALNEVESIQQGLSSKGESDHVKGLVWHGDNTQISFATHAFQDGSVTLADGSNFSVRQFGSSINGRWTDPSKTFAFGTDYEEVGFIFSDESITTGSAYSGNTGWGGLSHHERNDLDSEILVMDAPSWSDLWDQLETKHTEIINDISTWGSTVYGSIQSGDLNLDELLALDDLSSMLPEDEEGARAVMDLWAMNVPVDLDREYHISVDKGVANVQMYGTLAISQETTVSAGDTIDPTAQNAQYFFAHDISQYHGNWTNYETAINGGTLVLTAEPLESVVWEVTTTAEETVTFTTPNLTDQGDGTWTIDLSAELEDPITEVDVIDFYSSYEDPQMEAIVLQDPFTIESITDESGADVTEPVDYTEPVETHTDSNYTTAQAFQDYQEEMDATVTEIEEELASGGGGGGLIGGLLDGVGSGIVTVALIVGAIYAIVSGSR